MIDLKTTTAAQLLDPSFAKEVAKEAYQAMCFIGRRTQELAEFFAKTLDLDGQRNLSPLEKEYSIWVSRLRFAVLSNYSEKEIEDYFKNRIYDALGLEELDIMTALKAKMVELFIIERDGFRERLRRALTDNIQTVPGPALVVGNDSYPSTVQNWFKDYFSQIGTNTLSDLKTIQYFANSRNFNNALPAEKVKLKQLFRLYNKLMLPSTSVQGFDETLTYKNERGEIFDVDNGRLVKIYSPVGRSQTLSNGRKISPVTAQGNSDPYVQLYSKYHFFRQQRSNILEVEDGILTKTKGDLELVKRELSTAVRQGEKFGTAACLFILANQQALITALRDNPSWFASTAEYIQKKYAPAYSQDQIKFAVSNLKLEPATPAALSEFLQYILRDKMKMSENDSALVGAEIGQILGGHYQSLAYGNPDTGNFEWIKNKIVDGKLVSEID